MTGALSAMLRKRASLSRKSSVASRRKLRQAQVRFHAGEQLARGERLDQIVVGAGVEAFDARLLAGARREQDDRQVAQSADRRAARAAGRSRRGAAS